jgi:hypothetical protein
MPYHIIEIARFPLSHNSVSKHRSPSTIELHFLWLVAQPMRFLSYLGQLRVPINLKALAETGEGFRL